MLEDLTEEELAELNDIFDPEVCDVLFKKSFNS